MKVERFASVLVAVVMIAASSSFAYVPQARNDWWRPETLKQGLFLHTFVGSIGPTDPIIQRIIDGKNIEAAPGRKVQFQNDSVETWKSYSADSAGWFKGQYLQSGYGLFTIRSDRDRTALLEGMGNDLVYVNGVPMQGNKYAYKDKYPPWEPAFNFSILPVHLRKGDNQLLFVCYRGLLKVELTRIPPGVLFNVKHLTLPNFLVGKSVDYWAAVTLINATDRPLKGAFIKAYNDSGFSATNRVPLIQPMSIRKIGFKLVGPAPSSVGITTIDLTLMTGSDPQSKVLAKSQIFVETVEPTSTHNITFISTIDSSVQYYALVPPRGPNNGKPKALFLSLHGAGVIATNQANSYYPKTWGYIVCPTNGGPYGYDWEDWGRIDALQVLHIAKSTLNINPDRIYLTGHSMGGHGTWIIGAQYPDQFGAIGPSAGWISWWTYVFHNGPPTSPIGKMLARSTNEANTYLLDHNFKQLGVYILQGSKDDNVPVTESIHMSDTLKTFDHDWIFHEEMGVGHWWGLNDEAGTDCVDWPPMFDYFARHARPRMNRINIIDFTTCNPGVSAKDYWLTIYAQERQLEPSKAVVKFVPSRNTYVGTTENVKILSFNLSRAADTSRTFNVNLDNTKLDGITVPEGAKHLWLEKQGGEWRMASRPPAGDKGPVRYGTFKDAFRHDMTFVYGTHGTQVENNWAFDKARFDAEYFWYQGGGSVEIVSDREFNPAEDPNGNVILYGNEKTNSAWNEVLGNSPVTVTNDLIRFGDKTLRGDNYSCFMVRPRKGSTVASVGVVAGTGIRGMRLTYIVPYLQPWFSLPDLTIIDTNVFRNGEKSKGGFYGMKNEGQIGFGERGIRVAGFFGLDWTIKHGQFVEQ